MFEVGFTEIILILGLALIVLGPEKLPGLAEKLGRWTGRARSMARQLRTQLEQEVTIEELAKSRPMQSQPPTPTPETTNDPAGDYIDPTSANDPPPDHFNTAAGETPQPTGEPDFDLDRYTQDPLDTPPVDDDSAPQAPKNDKVVS